MTLGVLILSHGRADNVSTLGALERGGWTGPTYILVDDEDPQQEAYYERHGAMVRSFSKRDYDDIDMGYPSPTRKSVVYARRAAFDVAQDLGLTHLVQLDDDYNGFRYRFLGEKVVHGSKQIRDLDAVFDTMVALLEDAGALVIAMSTGADNVGGAHIVVRGEDFIRKAMNVYVCRADRPIPFVGRLNEDVNAFCLGGSRGDLYMTVPHLQLVQAGKRRAGGLTEANEDAGDWTAAFVTTMMCPSFVSIPPRPEGKELVVRVNQAHAYPKILAPEVAKSDG